jgi:hypothetical protein
MSIEQRFGRHDESRCADSTLERRMFEKPLLQGMQSVTTRDPFDGRHGSPFGFGGQHHARINESTVEYHIACAAISVVAAFFGARQSEHVPEHFQQTVPRLTKKLSRTAVQGGPYV